MQQAKETTFLDFGLEKHFGAKSSGCNNGQLAFWEDAGASTSERKTRLRA